MPIRPWRVSPLKYATPSAISEGSRRRKHCASASIFARRLRVAATRSEAARSSVSSMIDSGTKNLYGLPRCPGIPKISGFDHRRNKEHPRGEETKAADRRDRAEPALPGERERVQASGEEHDSSEHQPARPFQQCRFRKLRCDEPDREQAERVIDVVLNAGVPYREHLGRQVGF